MHATMTDLIKVLNSENLEYSSTAATQKTVTMCGGKRSRLLATAPVSYYESSAYLTTGWPIHLHWAMTLTIII